MVKIKSNRPKPMAAVACSPGMLADMNKQPTPSNPESIAQKTVRTLAPCNIPRAIQRASSANKTTMPYEITQMTAAMRNVEKPSSSPLARTNGRMASPKGASTKNIQNMV